MTNIPVIKGLDANQTNEENRSRLIQRPVLWRRLTFSGPRQSIDAGYVAGQSISPGKALYGINYTICSKFLLCIHTISMSKSI